MSGPCSVWRDISETVEIFQPCKLHCVCGKEQTHYNASFLPTDLKLTEKSRKLWRVRVFVLFLVCSCWCFVISELQLLYLGLALYIQSFKLKEVSQLHETTAEFLSLEFLPQRQPLSHSRSRQSDRCPYMVMIQMMTPTRDRLELLEHKFEICEAVLWNSTCHNLQTPGWSDILRLDPIQYILK